MSERCETCGDEIAVGSWPFCPHGAPTLTLRPDSIPGGMLVENLGREAIRVDSSTEWRRAMQKAGVRQVDGNRFLTPAGQTRG
jgi:hypothetical protein